MSRDIVQQLNSLIDILCLSRVNDSLLMWPKYRVISGVFSFVHAMISLDLAIGNAAHLDYVHA